MNSKFFFFKLFLVLSLITSCNRSEEVYIQLLNKEIEDSHYFLKGSITQQDSFIEFKVNESGIPGKKERYDSLQVIKTKIDSCIKKTLQQSDSTMIKKFKVEIENESGEYFRFNSLMTKTKINDSVFSELIKLDLLKMKYLLNTKFIAKNCNFVY